MKSSGSVASGSDTAMYTFRPISNYHKYYVEDEVRSILNKLTPDTFDKLSLELLNVGIDSQTVLKGIILLIVDKALDEPKYSSLYSQLCHRLCQDAPNFEPQQSSISTFHRLLLTKCQDEFENRSRATEAFEKAVLFHDHGSEEAWMIAKWQLRQLIHVIANYFILGELGKLDMLDETIMHWCIQQLLEMKKSGVKDMSEDLECLCQLLRTVGKTLDHDKAKAWMDRYFERIKLYQSNEELPSRICFMLQDVVELRGCNWQPRKLQGREEAPRTIQQSGPRQLFPCRLPLFPLFFPPFPPSPLVPIPPPPLYGPYLFGPWPQFLPARQPPSYGGFTRRTSGDRQELEDNQIGGGEGSDFEGRGEYRESSQRGGGGIYSDAGSEEITGIRRRGMEEYWGGGSGGYRQGVYRSMHRGEGGEGAAAHFSESAEASENGARRRRRRRVPVAERVEEMESAVAEKLVIDMGMEWDDQKKKSVRRSTTIIAIVVGLIIIIVSVVIFIHLKKAN